MPHRYRITVEPLTPKAGPPLIFEADNHDDIIAVARRIAASGTMTEREAAELAVGLKLFGEVVLRHRRDPVFSPMLATITDFMKRFKARVMATE
jgi:hypothetical protein